MKVINRRDIPAMLDLARREAARKHQPMYLSPTIYGMALGAFPAAIGTPYIEVMPDGVATRHGYMGAAY
jgi:hypothetical protein